MSVPENTSTPNTPQTMNNNQKNYDVVIVGGGIAGLGLARQLRLEAPTLSIVVLETNMHPVPVAAHKVGESTVEIGAHYLSHTLQLKPYLDKFHLKKFGLRCYFGNGSDIAKADELGASESLPVSSYQVDRGMLENHLVTTLRSDGTEVVDGARVISTDFQSDGSGLVKFSKQEADYSITGRWVIDASGRRGLFRRKLGLKIPNNLNGNACWFRVNKRICIDDWSSDPAWHNRIRCGERWLSTNHLMGHGYWVWIIPLGSGATSIGIVASDDRHRITQFNTHERALEWLAIHQPQCAKALEGLEPLDFAWVRNYSYGCSEVFSRKPDKERWALTGEAGLFLDPFYSPGMDFIAYANTFISDLIKRESKGENVRTRQLIYQQTFQSIYESSLRLYLNQYEAFGNFRIMSLKTVWDYAYYWGVLGHLFFNDALTDIELLNSRTQALSDIRHRHDQLQQLFSRAAAGHPVEQVSGGFTDHFGMPLLHRLNSELAENLSGEAIGRRLDENLVTLEELAMEIEMVLQAEVRVDSDPAPGQINLLKGLTNLADVAS